MTEAEPSALVSNIAGHLRNAAERIQYRHSAVCHRDAEYGVLVARGLGLDAAEVAKLAGLSHEARAERAKRASGGRHARAAQEEGEVTAGAGL